MVRQYEIKQKERKYHKFLSSFKSQCLILLLFIYLFYNRMVEENVSSSQVSSILTNQHITVDDLSVNNSATMTSVDSISHFQEKVNKSDIMRKAMISRIMIAKELSQQFIEIVAKGLFLFIYICCSCFILSFIDLYCATPILQ